MSKTTATPTQAALADTSSSIADVVNYDLPELAEIFQEMRSRICDLFDDPEHEYVQMRMADALALSAHYGRKGAKAYQQRTAAYIRRLQRSSYQDRDEQIEKAMLRLDHAEEEVLMYQAVLEAWKYVNPEWTPPADRDAVVRMSGAAVEAEQKLRAMGLDKPTTSARREQQANDAEKWAESVYDGSRYTT